MNYYNRELIRKVNDVIFESINIATLIDSVWKFDFDNSIMLKVKKIDTYVKKCVYSLEFYILNYNINLSEFDNIKQILFYLSSIQDIIHNYLMNRLIKKSIEINMEEMVQYINIIEGKIKLLKI